MNIYVGNLSYGARDNDLQELFSEFGQVESAQVIIDRETGRSRGFGFVVMPDNEQAKQAIEALNEKEHDGRALKINEARERESRPSRQGDRY